MVDYATVLNNNFKPSPPKNYNIIKKEKNNPNIVSNIFHVKKNIFFAFLPFDLIKSSKNFFCTLFKYLNFFLWNQQTQKLKIFKCFYQLNLWLVKFLLNLNFLIFLLGWEKIKSFLYILKFCYFFHYLN